MDFGRTPPANLIAEDSGVVPLAALVALSSDGFFFVAADATIMQWSEAAAALSGLETANALRRDVRELFIKGETIVAVPFDGRAHEARVALALPQETRWLRLSVIGVNVDVHTHGWLCSFGPERRYREIEQLKSEIVATVSHELKTPIASIKAYATTLRENPGTAAAFRDEFLAVIDEQADYLSRAVDKLLLASRVDAEQLLRHRVPIPLDEVLDAALCVLLLDEAKHPIVRKTAGVVLSGDPELLRDILFHLVENAAKFSLAGAPIEIRGRNSEHESIIEVSDHGVGIPEEHLPYIFDRFYRVERDLTAQASGTGLGLSIAQALVRAHGGSISVASTPGAGTTFTVRLPIRPPS